MKTNLLKAFAFAIAMTPFYNCSVEPTEEFTQELETSQLIENQTFDEGICNGQDPKSRLTNNSDNVVDLEIHDANGALVNYVYGLNPGEMSDWKAFPVGTTSFTISSVESVKVVTISMGLCMAYEVSINENNHLDSDSPIQL